MYMLGYSLNNLTLMALTISTGFVVDDAIVMIENIIRYIEEGEEPLAAALKGAGQIGFTIVSLSVSLIAVLIPLVVHAGHRGAAVSGICGDAERDDRGLGGGVVDADADDVRATAAAQAGVAAGVVLSEPRSGCLRGSLRCMRGRCRLFCGTRYTTLLVAVATLR